MRAKRRGFILLSALLALPPATPASPAAPSTGGAVVSVVVKDAAVRPGDTVTVTVKIAGADDVGSVPFTIRYDASILEFLDASAVEGDFLRRGGATTSFIVSEGSASRGGGVVVGLSRLGSGRGARGKGTLCRLAFRARRPGVSALTFSRALVLDPSARPRPSTFRGSSIAVRSGP